MELHYYFQYLDLKQMIKSKNHKKLSVIIPCYNEEHTLEHCVERLLKISDNDLSLEVAIIDDGSIDKSNKIAHDLARKHSEVRVIRHNDNLGKGAAIKTGIKNTSGEFIAIQDADLEYDPSDLKKLLQPLIHDYGDIVLGSRFMTRGFHRVLYFWHYLGNKFLTFLSNIFTNINLTDMETCYKVFRREVFDNIEIREKRFGFEPEIIAKMSHRNLRIYEMGVSYFGRTYEEGKKIKAADGLRAIYCIIHYNIRKTHWPIQFFVFVCLILATNIFSGLITNLFKIINLNNYQLIIEYLITPIFFSLSFCKIFLHDGLRNIKLILGSLLIFIAFKYIISLTYIYNNEIIDSLSKVIIVFLYFILTKRIFLFNKPNEL